MTDIKKIHSERYYSESEKLYDSIKPALAKVIIELDKDIGKLRAAATTNAVINAYYLDVAVGNHMCDDHPEWFGITKNDGHKIREYFQSTGANYPFREYIYFLHRDFPQYMQKEEEWYVEDANEDRIEHGAKPINPKTYELE